MNREWRSGGVEEWGSGGVEEWRSGGVGETYSTSPPLPLFPSPFPLVPPPG